MDAARSPDHPSELLTAAYLEGTLDPEASDRIERHLAQCVPCRSLVLDARASAGALDLAVPSELLLRAREMTGKVTGVEARGIKALLKGWTTPVRWILAGGAVTATLVIVAVVLVPRPASEERGAAPVEPGDAHYRASGQDELMTLAPLPGATVVGPEATFTWSARADADRYVVTVLDTQGSVLATIEARPKQKVGAQPATSSSAVFTWTGKRPATLLWKVRALRLDRTLSESRPASFVLR